MGGLGECLVEIWVCFDLVGIWEYVGFSGTDEFSGVGIWESRLFSGFSGLVFFVFFEGSWVWGGLILKMKREGWEECL